MNYPRRQFLKQTAVGVGGIFLGSRLAAAASEPAPSAKFDPFATVPLGRSKLKVSRFCLGTGMNLDPAVEVQGASFGSQSSGLSGLFQHK